MVPWLAAYILWVLSFSVWWIWKTEVTVLLLDVFLYFYRVPVEGKDNFRHYWGITHWLLEPKKPAWVGGKWKYKLSFREKKICPRTCSFAVIFPHVSNWHKEVLHSLGSSLTVSYRKELMRAWKNPRAISTKPRRASLSSACHPCLWMEQTLLLSLWRTETTLLHWSSPHFSIGFLCLFPERIA